MIVWMVVAAFAQEARPVVPDTSPAVDRYAWEAPVTFPAESGVYRIDVPVLLRTQADPSNGSDLLLVDGTGRAVPVAWTHSDLPAEQLGLAVTPSDHDTWQVAAVDRPLDGIDVEVASGSAATATVTWDGGSATETVWRLDDGSSSRIDLPSVRGPFTVTLDWHLRPGSGAVVLTGLRDPAARVAPVRMTLPVTDWRLEERQWARYSVPLPHPLPVQAVYPHPEGDVFDRGVAVTAAPLEDWDWPYASARISRVHLGTVAADRLRVPVSLGAVTTLVLYVDSTGQAPLAIPDVEIELPGEAGFLRDPGPGPHILYGGAPAGTSPPQDLAVALPELATMAGDAVAVGPVGPNPDYVPPEVRSGIGLPGAPVEASFKWHRAVVGAGLSRVPLDADVLRHARSDLGDVRLVTTDGRQVPYLVQRTGRDQPMDVTFDRTEDGSTSRLVVHLPDDRPVSTVSIRTDAPLFSRRVVLQRGRGSHLEPVRAFDWTGSDRPEVLTLEVDQVVGDTLVVSIDNGSNPPLPITGVTATWPAWELVAVLPDGGAELRYGASRLGPPVYDLTYLGGDLVTRADAVATLGDPVSTAAPLRTWWDTLVLLAGLGVLALGLLALTISLVRAVPDEEPAPGGDPA